MKKTHGFTLIELMIVIAILGIVMAIVIPACSDSAFRYNFVCKDDAGTVVKQVGGLEFMPSIRESGQWHLGEGEFYTPMPGTTCERIRVEVKKGAR